MSVLRVHLVTTTERKRVPVFCCCPPHLQHTPAERESRHSATQTPTAAPVASCTLQAARRGILQGHQARAAGKHGSSFPAFLADRLHTLRWAHRRSVFALLCHNILSHFATLIGFVEEQKFRSGLLCKEGLPNAHLKQYVFNTFWD